MTDTPGSTTSIDAAFADAAQAERAVAQLQEHGVDPDRIDIDHGHTARPGRTAAEDRDTLDRMSGSWWFGWVVGALSGAVVGAVIGGFSIGWGRPVFWGIVVGLTVAFGALGGLWGFFAGFAARANRRGRTGDRTDPAQARQRAAAEPPQPSGQPEVPDAVRVIVRVTPDEHDTVLRILRAEGGAS
ncbi:MAG: hypothetical protein KY460_00900 [Actinobacteria bacterium]|nr:hypothetical protein [Actinomycetota bacterium]